MVEHRTGDQSCWRWNFGSAASISQLFHAIGRSAVANYFVSTGNSVLFDNFSNKTSWDSGNRKMTRFFNITREPKSKLTGGEFSHSSNYTVVGYYLFKIAFPP